MTGSVALQIVAAVFAFLAAAVQLRRWVQLGRAPAPPDAQRLRARAAISVLAFLIAGTTGAAAAVLRAREADESDVNEYQDCIDEQQQRQGEPSGGLGDMADEYCERHRQCEHLEGEPEEYGGITPEGWCEVLG